MDEQEKLYNKFTREVEKLSGMKKDYFDNKRKFQVNIDMDNDSHRRTVINDIVQSIQSKEEKNLYIKYQHSFRFYYIMTQYKKRYEEEGSKKVTQKLMNDIDLSHSYQIIKKTLRIHHLFNCPRLIGINEAYKNCQISTREFYLLSDSKWNTISKIYDFNEQYLEDYLYWKVKRRKVVIKESEEESDKTISDIAERKRKAQYRKRIQKLIVNKGNGNENNEDTNPQKRIRTDDINIEQGQNNEGKLPPQIQVAYIIAICTAILNPKYEYIQLNENIMKRNVDHYLKQIQEGQKICPYDKIISINNEKQ
ncbi:460_t:CDS:2 [Funneliformis geosporum]|uniref:460_t:CDS:1 n=1 Tax=Funneliformis geosporum TaxID=1117311 RepID=A0A9W4SQK0_9GLOM|nr:460_t:CDS:2 [Funneliformis geosporum]